MKLQKRLTILFSSLLLFGMTSVPANAAYKYVWTETTDFTSSSGYRVDAAEGSVALDADAGVMKIYDNASRVSHVAVISGSTPRAAAVKLKVDHGQTSVHFGSSNWTTATLGVFVYPDGYEIATGPFGGKGILQEKTAFSGGVTDAVITVTVDEGKELVTVVVNEDVYEYPFSNTRITAVKTALTTDFKTVVIRADQTVKAVGDGERAALHTTVDYIKLSHQVTSEAPSTGADEDDYEWTQVCDFTASTSYRTDAAEGSVALDADAGMMKIYDNASRVSHVAVISANASSAATAKLTVDHGQTSVHFGSSNWTTATFGVFVYPDGYEIATGSFAGKSVLQSKTVFAEGVTDAVITVTVNESKRFVTIVVNGDRYDYSFDRLGSGIVSNLTTNFKTVVIRADQTVKSSEGGTAAALHTMVDYVKLGKTLNVDDGTEIPDDDDDFVGTRIVCCGDSITEGVAASSSEKAYPAQLQLVLGDEYLVKNFGIGGASAIGNGTLAYKNTDPYQKALTAKPDIVVLMLGMNDANPTHAWNGTVAAPGAISETRLKEYKNEMLSLIESFEKLESKPTIYLVSTTPMTRSVGESFSESYVTAFNANLAAIRKLQKEIAGEKGLILIDGEAPLDKSEYFSDGCHLTNGGYQKLAEAIGAVLLGNHDGVVNPEDTTDGSSEDVTSDLPDATTADNFEQSVGESTDVTTDGVQDGETKPDNTGLIIGVATAVVVVIAVVAVVVFKKRK